MQIDTQSDTNSGTKIDTKSKPRRSWSTLVAMVCIYALWLGWLTYVASVNVQSGNQ
jgi:hypothetical protein